MNNVFSSVLSNLKRAWSPMVTTTRQFERKPYDRRYGYRDKLLISGLLPRDPNNKKRLPMPVYEPKNAWAEKRALFGQNDYIDILGSGDETIHPVRTHHGVPFWLRGFRGNEFHMLIRKRKILGQRLKMTNLPKYNEMQKRIRYVFKYINQKTRN